MRLCWFAFAIILALSSPHPAAAQTGLTFPLDTLTNWSMTQSEGLLDGRNARVLEFVPQDQTVERWTEMITIMAIDTRHADTRPTGQTLYDEMTASYRAVCGQTSFGEPAFSVEDGLATTTFSLACDVVQGGPTAGSGEYTYVKVIEAPPGNLFIAQRAWRGDLPDPSVRPITDAQFGEWMSFFADVRVPLQ
jgi:hypothetical protein